MPFTDYTAADKVRELREAAGYNSAEAMAIAIRNAASTAKWGEKGTVDGWTIRKVEEGHVPGPRIRYVLAGFFDCEQSEIWQSRNWQVVETSIATARRKAARA